MSAAEGRRRVGVAVAGFGWMGRVHTQAYARVLHHFPELTVAPALAAVADEVPGRAEAAGVAMAEAGKHVWVEKPVGLTTDDARAVADAAERAGVQGTVGFNYRNAPAVTAARELIAGGQLGTVTHARAVGGELGQVENEDYVSSLLRLASGARVVLEASRVAVGEQNSYGFEIDGTKGAVSWDFRRMSELAVSLADAVRSAATLDAMAESAGTGTWVEVAAT